MKRRRTSTDGFDAVKRCFDAYGADILKWPSDKRERFGALALSDEMAPMRKEAEALDGFLGAATAPSLSADLKNRIVAQYESPSKTVTLGDVLDSLFSRRQFLPAGALAGVGALGLVSGILTANTQAALTPEAEAYVYVEELMGAALLYQQEAVQWDED